MHLPAGYGDIVGEIASCFSDRIKIAEEAGIERDQIILDPGIGFSKNAPQSLKILKNARAFSTLARPMLIGHSRKSMIGKHLGIESPEERLEGTLALSAFCAWNNVAIIRVHDIIPNIRAVRMIEAMKGEGI
jgi:dihydropteroate synthase